MHSSSSLSTMTTEEDNVVRVPHNRLELLSRTAAWRNLMDRSTEEVSDIPSFPGRVTPAEPGVFFPDPSFGSRSVNSSSVHSWTAVRPVTRNDMSFDEGEHTPSHAFGNYCDQSKPPAAALDSSERATLALEKNQHSHNMLRPQPVSSFARPKPSLPSASNGHLSMQAAFAPPRSCAFTEQSTSTGRLASRPAGPPPSLHSQYLPGNPPESYYAYSSSSICTLRPTPARSVSAVATLPQSDRSWMSHPPTNHHGSHGGYATLPSSEGPSYQALVDENAKLRHQTQQKDAAVAALEAKVRHLETQIEELRQLPTGKISHIPIQYVHSSLLHILWKSVSVDSYDASTCTHALFVFLCISQRHAHHYGGVRIGNYRSHSFDSTKGCQCPEVFRRSPIPSLESQLFGILFVPTRRMGPESRSPGRTRPARASEKPNCQYA
jgi:hypothetical protein